jgi:hypothetical protein
VLNLKILFLVLLLTACASSGSQNTPDSPGECAATLSEDITVPTVFKNSAAECDYFIRGRLSENDTIISDIEVRSGLTIEPGTVVKFDKDIKLSIDSGGSITAVGTPEARIRLEGFLEVQGYWTGLCFDGNRESRLEYVDLLWAGQAQASGGGTTGGQACSAAIGGVNEGGEAVAIKNSLIAGSSTQGLDAQLVTLGEFEKNVFANIAQYSVIAEPDQVHKLDGATDYLGTSLNSPNGQPYVFLAGLYQGQGESVTWRSLNAPYFTDEFFPYGDNIIISESVTITVEAGARFEFGAEGTLNLWDGAALQVIGTAENPVVFTGKEKTPGAWAGIDFVDAGLSVLEHTEVSYGGRNDFNGNIYIHGVENGSDVVIRNSLIAYSATCGIAINAESSSLEAIEVTFRDNANDQTICQ